MNTLPPPETLLNPEKTFEDWLYHPGNRFSESTRIIYRSMFSKFSSWLAERHRSILNFDDHDLEAFLESTNQRTRHRYRYVRIIERFFVFMRIKGVLKRENPGSHAARRGVGMGKDDDSCFLSIEECAALSTWIGRRVESGENQVKSKKSRHWSQFAEWRRARDKALAAVMCFGGVKVSEAAGMSVNCITNEWLIHIPQANRIPFHDAYLLEGGRASITAWLELRRSAGIAGDRLFPSDDLGAPMHASSMYRAVHSIAEAAFKAAGLEVPEARLSPQTLRNTYAALLLDGGFNDTQVMHYMGLHIRHFVRMKETWKQQKATP